MEESRETWGFLFPVAASLVAAGAAAGAQDYPTRPVALLRRIHASHRADDLHADRLSLEESILSTVVDGFHRGDNWRIVGETVACSKPENCELLVYRQLLFGLVENYATIQTLQSLVPSAVRRPC